MKIQKILKAIFSHKEKPVELNLSAAEIREGKAFLHPKDEKGVTYLVKSDNIEISLSKGLSLNSKDVIRIEEKKKSTTKTNDSVPKPAPAPSKKDTTPSTSPSASTEESPDPFEKYKKRTFSISLYPEEYDTITARMKDYGYSRADFVLACVNTATKGTMEREHKKIIKNHTALKKEQKILRTQKRTNNPANL